MRQAIVTKYLGPTNFRGSRVRATASAGSVTVPWDSSKDAEDNHYAAALALALKFEWCTPYDLEKGAVHIVGGGLPDGRGNAYVLVYL